MAGQSGTEGGRGVVSRSVAGAFLLGCLALGILLGTIGTSSRSSSSSNLRDGSHAQKHTTEALMAPHGSKMMTPKSDGVGGVVGAWGPDADAKDDWSTLFEAGAWGPKDEGKREWNAAFGAGSVKVFDQLDADMSFSFSYSYDM